MSDWNFKTTIFDEPIKKRRMRKTVKRLDEERLKTRGETLTGKLRSLQNVLYKKNKWIEELKGRLRSIGDVHAKEIHELNKVHRRELRKKDTLHNRTKKKLQECRERKPRSSTKKVVKWKHYEPPTKIRNFEKIVETLRGQPEHNLELFEKITKVFEAIENYNEESDFKINLNHYLVLVNLDLLRGEIKGVTAPTIQIPTLSPHMIRKTLRELENGGLVSKWGKIKYRINILGDEFLETVRNKQIKGKSFTLESIKRTAGFHEEQQDNRHD